MIKHLIYIFISLIFAGCISDEISTSPSHLPVFSADTLSLGEIWADELSPTGMVTIRNRNSKGISISAVSISGADASCIKVNMNGVPVEYPVENFAPMDIRQNDSIVMLAAATPHGVDSLDARVGITVNGVELSIPVSAKVRQPLTLRDHTVCSELSLSGDVRVFGTLTVEEGATLTIEPGTTLFMHDKAEITVSGTIIADGSPEEPITICGDRFGFLAADIPYGILPGQWGGITVQSGGDNSLCCTSVMNSEAGLSLAPQARLSLSNCCIANSRESLVTLGEGAELYAIQCQLTESAKSVLSLSDATANLYRCTLANSYLFGSQFCSLIELNGCSQLDVEASIVFYPGGELSASAESVYKFTDTLFGSKGSDDNEFINCLWGENPEFCLDTETYTFDYRLSPGSAALNHPLTFPSRSLPHDRFGTPPSNPSALGAYN